MISVEDRELIRRAYFIEHKSLRQIARELHVARKTIGKALASAEAESYKLSVASPGADSGALQAADRGVAGREQASAGQAALHQPQDLRGARAARLPGGRIDGAWLHWPASAREQRRPQVYLPLEFDPGSDAQVDWGEAVAEVAGVRQTVQLFCMRLCYSRRTFLMAFPTQRQEAFLEGHVQAFHFFAGVPQRIAYDNLKAAVEKVLSGHTRQEQQTFVAFRSHYLFDELLLHARPGPREGRRGACGGLWAAQLSWCRSPRWPRSRR